MSSIQAPKRIHLDAVRLINCQGIEDITYDFAPGLNVIRGKNNAGKSIFFKVLKAAACVDYYSNDEKAELIRHGAEYAMGIYLFSDGSAAAVKIFPKHCTYHYTEVYGQEPFDASMRPNPIALRKLSLLVDQEEKYIANILDLDQSLLLVSSNYKANHNLVKLITEHETLRQLIQNTKEKIDSENKNLMQLDDLVVQLDYRFRKYQHVDVSSYERAIANTTAGLEVYETLLSACRELDSVDVMQIDDRDFPLLLKACEIYEEGVRFVNDMEHLFEDELNEDLVPILDVYEILQSAFSLVVNSPPIVVSEVPASALFPLLDAYELASSVQIIEGINPDLLDILKVYELLQSADIEFRQAFNHTQVVKSLEVEIGEIKEYLNNNARRVPCVLYGEVQYIDGQCIPVDTRLASSG